MTLARETVRTAHYLLGSSVVDDPQAKRSNTWMVARLELQPLMLDTFGLPWRGCSGFVKAPVPCSRKGRWRVQRNTVDLYPKTEQVSW